MGKVVYILLILFIVTTCQKIPTDVVEPVSIIDTLLSSWAILQSSHTNLYNQDGWYHVQGEGVTHGGFIDVPQTVYNSITVSILIKTELSHCHYYGDILCVSPIEEHISGMGFEGVVGRYRVEKVTRTFVLDSLYHNIHSQMIRGDELAHPDSINYFGFLLTPTSTSQFAGDGNVYVKNLLITAERK